MRFTGSYLDPWTRIALQLIFMILIMSFLSSITTCTCRFETQSPALYIFLMIKNRGLYTLYNYYIYIGLLGISDRKVHHLLWPLRLIRLFIFMYDFFLLKKTNFPFIDEIILVNKLLLSFYDPAPVKAPQLPNQPTVGASFT